MPAERKIILGDLGGTHLRLAHMDAKGHDNVRNYTIRDWPNLSAVLNDYAPDLKGARLFLSFAKKYNPGGVYRFDPAYKNDAWEFSIDALKTAHGLRDVQVVHDFYAMALALFHNSPDVFERVTQGVQSSRLRAVIGVGTGCGHALADPSSRYIYDTFGGHMPPGGVTPEQKDMISKLESNFGTTRTFIWEEILSGRGLQAMYKTLGGKNDDIAAADDHASRAAIRLFCEFLGIYANVVCVTGHAYGGLYLTGGVIEKLIAASHFDWTAFQRNFYLNMVHIVDQALRETPIYKARSGHTALYGLEVFAKDAA